MASKSRKSPSPGRKRNTEDWTQVMPNRPHHISLRALDWLNFFMADVNTGIGPFLAIYLTATRHWNPASVGMVVAAQAVAGVAAQVPAGWLVDNSTRKKW